MRALFRLSRHRAGDPSVALSCLFVTFMLSAVGVHAQSSQVPRLSEDVLVTAALVPVPEAWASRAVTVYRRADLERMGVASIADALRLVPGADPRARGPRGVQTDFSLRGATFGQALVLVDGLRLNDSQSGHHNGDIPMALSGIDRIEVVNGPASVEHGADALGGTVNVISRTDPHAEANVSLGQFGYAAADASLGGHGLPEGWILTGWGQRSGGFTFDREFAAGGGALRGSIGRGWTLDVRHQRKAFGAAGFYGPSPSREWTDQTLAAIGWSGAAGAWTTSTSGLYRNHGDHFRWDINRPGYAENRHRTDAAAFDTTATRPLSGGRFLTLGTSGGTDLVRSTNLGDHRYSRASAVVEMQSSLGTRAVVQIGGRADHYSTFGTSWSPTAGLAFRPIPAVKLRASVARAFRVPTFTELYYHDPANLGSPDLRAEHGWSIDGGIDWATGAWTASFSPFRRWDTNVIDWVRQTTADLWRSTNVRDVTTTGFEASALRRWTRGFVRVYHAGLTVDAPSLTVLSKYVLEYARHQSGGSVVLPIGREVSLAVDVDHRQRLDGQSYSLVHARLSRRFGSVTAFVDAANLTNARYHEIAGVAEPGRWIMAGVSIVR